MPAAAPGAASRTVVGHSARAGVLPRLAAACSSSTGTWARLVAQADDGTRQEHQRICARMVKSV